MKTYTVIGLYDADGQTYADEYQGKDAFDAMAHCAAHMRDEGFANSFQIIGAIEGKHDVTAPCDDSHKAAYAADL